MKHLALCFSGAHVVTNVFCGKGTLITTVYSKQADRAAMTARCKLQVEESKEENQEEVKRDDDATEQVDRNVQRFRI